MPAARKRSRMEALSYPFSQKMCAACCSPLASRRSKGESGGSGPAFRMRAMARPLRLSRGTTGSRVSTLVRAIFKLSYRTFVRILIMTHGCSARQFRMLWIRVCGRFAAERLILKSDQKMEGPVMTDRELLINIYDAFNHRDIDTVLASLHADVHWANGSDSFRGTQDTRLPGELPIAPSPQFEIPRRLGFLMIFRAYAEVCATRSPEKVVLL